MSFWRYAYYGVLVSKVDNYNDVAILTICPFGTVHAPYQACMPHLQWCSDVDNMSFWHRSGAIPSLYAAAVADNQLQGHRLHWARSTGPCSPSPLPWSLWERTDSGRHTATGTRLFSDPHPDTRADSQVSLMDQFRSWLWRPLADPFTCGRSTWG